MSVWRRAGREPRDLIESWRRDLQGLAARRGDRIEMRVNQHWIAFRSASQGRAFAEIRPSRHRVEVFLLPERRDLSDPAGIARPAPRTQGWNWFRSKFTVVGNGHGRAALSLLRQSYEHGTQKSRSLSPSSSRARQDHLQV